MISAETASPAVLIEQLQQSVLGPLPALSDLEH